MDKNELKNFCDQWLDAWSGNRPELLRSFYSHDAFYRDPHKINGIRGDEILPYFQKLLKLNPDWRWKTLELFPNETGACLKWQASIPVSNKVIIETGMDLLEIKNGLITRNEVYFDRTAWLKACQP